MTLTIPIKKVCFWGKKSLLEESNLNMTLARWLDICQGTTGLNM